MTYDLKVGIIGGSGLDDPDILEDRTEDYVDTVFGKPSDALIHGKIGGVPCVILARHGRKHDILPGEINYRANIWALKSAGCTHIIASHACGSMKEEVRPGDLVFLDSFIDRTTKREQTFYDGKTPGRPKGICHCPMDTPYAPKLRDALIETAKEMGISFHQTGTCVCIEGPRFSSKAESNVFRSWGASVIGMTAVPEVVLANEAGILFASVAMATDYDCWHETEEKVSADKVLITFKNNVNKMTDLLKKTVPKLAEIDWTGDIKEQEVIIKILQIHKNRTK